MLIPGQFYPASTIREILPQLHFIQQTHSHGHDVRVYFNKQDYNYWISGNLGPSGQFGYIYVGTPKGGLSNAGESLSLENLYHEDIQNLVEGILSASFDGRYDLPVAAINSGRYGTKSFFRYRFIGMLIVFAYPMYMSLSKYVSNAIIVIAFLAVCGLIYLFLG